MKKGVLIFLLAFSAKLLFGQHSFKTLVPNSAVIAGEPFRVQYVVEDGDGLGSFTAPDFHQFKLIGGPDIYNAHINTGNPRNYIYTIVAAEPGRYIVPGTRANVNGKWLRSNDAFIEVITADMAARRTEKEGLSSDYYLKPGEDAQQKIKQNLFLKVSVNKQTCYTGEPVVATFKLYSRLQSKSDIVKNPGFYGFTMYDMVSLQDKLVTTENIGGKLFDVHTIRQVQLYPLQAGVYAIDEMRVKNLVEFSSSAVNKKTEQQIAEGMLGGQDDTPPGNAEVFESEISSEPIQIVVKPLADKNKPADYAGAVGAFQLSASLGKNSLFRNEEGMLELTISGKGNFIQLNAPKIQWPAGIEGFEPTVKDSLDKNQSPLKGTRTFRYAFTSSNPGRYAIASINISYFNPDSGKYKSLSTPPLQLTVKEQEKSSTGTNVNAAEPPSHSEARWWWLAGGAVLVAVVLLFWPVTAKKKPSPKKETVTEEKQRPDINQLLQPAGMYVLVDDKSFYTALQEALWHFFAQRYELSGSEMSKQSLQRVMEHQQAPLTAITTAQDLLAHCEAGIYTNAEMADDKTALLEKARELMKSLNA